MYLWPIWLLKEIMSDLNFLTKSNWFWLIADTRCGAAASTNFCTQHTTYEIWGVFTVDRPRTWLEKHSNASGGFKCYIGTIG